MEIDGKELLDALEGEAMFYSEASDKTMREIGERLDITASMLRNFRDTLISIAQCQNGIASHQAQDALKKAGYCYHFNSVYRYREEKGHEGSTWICHDCNTESPERPVPYR